MKQKKQQNLYSLILIGAGSLLLLLVGGPLLFSLLALGIGLFLINYGLLLRGAPSLMMLLQRLIEEIRIKFFNDR